MPRIYKGTETILKLLIDIPNYASIDKIKIALFTDDRDNAMEFYQDSITMVGNIAYLTVYEWTFAHMNDGVISYIAMGEVNAEPFIVDRQSVYFLKTSDGFEESEIMNGYYTKAEVDVKLEEEQDVLVSGKTIKTINGQSVLGPGNIEIDVDLTGYATEQWVKDQNYTTDEWVLQQNYVTDEKLDEKLADIEVDLTGYATEQWVKDQNYTTDNWVLEQDYVTDEKLEERLADVEVSVNSIYTFDTITSFDTGRISKEVALDAIAKAMNGEVTRVQTKNGTQQGVITMALSNQIRFIMPFNQYFKLYIMNTAGTFSVVEMREESEDSSSVLDIKIDNSDLSFNGFDVSHPENTDKILRLNISEYGDGYDNTKSLLGVKSSINNYEIGEEKDVIYASDDANEYIWTKEPWGDWYYCEIRPKVTKEYIDSILGDINSILTTI